MFVILSSSIMSPGVEGWRVVCSLEDIPSVLTLANPRCPRAPLPTSSPAAYALLSEPCFPSVWGYPLSTCPSVSVLLLLSILHPRHCSVPTNTRPPHPVSTSPSPCVPMPEFLPYFFLPRPESLDLRHTLKSEGFCPEILNMYLCKDLIYKLGHFLF